MGVTDGSATPHRKGFWPPPMGPNPQFRRGRWRLWDRVMWIDEPDHQTPWAEVVLRCAVLLLLASFFGSMLGNILVAVIAGARHGFLFPLFWPWLFAIAAAIAGLGGGHRMWSGISAAKAVVLVVLTSAFAFIAEHGYWVLWLTGPEFVLFLGLILRESRARKKATP